MFTPPNIFVYTSFPPPQFKFLEILCRGGMEKDKSNSDKSLDMIMWSNLEMGKEKIIPTCLLNLWLHPADNKFGYNSKGALSDISVQIIWKYI